MNWLRTLVYGYLFCLLWSCANQTQPTGGPKDEDPPILVSSEPQSGTLNFKSQTIELEFNEMIKADKLQQELIITPSTKSKFKTRIARNRLTLTFEEPFNDSTTYTLNFRESVKDVTESNPAEDLILVFSTGPVIDSLQISGNVSSLLTNTAASKYTVALYDDNDTLDLFNGTPLYAIQSERDGNFQFRNIKANTYRLFAWLDKNNDLECQSESEPFAFMVNTIQLDSNITEQNLFPQFLNLRPLSITASRQQGRYFEVRFSKPTISYTLQSLNQIDTLYHHYIEDAKAIRIYNTLTDPFEHTILLSAIDSAGFHVEDTIQFTFEETSRPPEPFESRVQKTMLKSTTGELQTSIQFNKPLIEPNDSIWQLTTDSTFLDLSQFEPTLAWRNNLLTIKATLPDSLTTKKDLNLTFPASSFLSIESDSSVLMSQKVQQQNPDDYGIIELSIEPDSLNFFVHLLDLKGNFIKEYPGSSKLVMEYLDAGKYQIRILIDSDNDGIWEPGNYLEGRLPEPVIFFYDEEANTGIITLKKNWVLGPYTINLTVDN